MARSCSLLVDRIGAGLKLHDFSEYAELQAPRIGTLHLIMTKRIMTVRTICVVFRIPNSVSRPAEFLKLCEIVRKQLTSTYAKFPYWKEIGFILVALCSGHQFELFENDLSRSRDRTGWHVSCLLGTFAVDLEQKRFACAKTWGLIQAVSYFKKIEEAVESWQLENCT